MEDICDQINQIKLKKREIKWIRKEIKKIESNLK